MKTRLDGTTEILDTTKAIIKRLERLGGNEDTYVEIAEEEIYYIAHVIIGACKIEVMSPKEIAMSEEHKECFKLKALERIVEDADLEEIALENMSSFVKLENLLSKGSRLGLPWENRPKIVDSAVLELSDESILELINHEGSCGIAYEGLIRAAVARCLIKDSAQAQLYTKMKKVVAKTNSTIILSQLNSDKHPKNLEDIYTDARKRMEKLGLENIKHCGID